MSRKARACLSAAAALTSIAFCLSAAPSFAKAPKLPPAVESHQLGYSGAIISIRETYERLPVAARTFILKGADGRIVTLRLNDGGGEAHNNALSLLSDRDNRTTRDRFILISEKDCLEFDPIKVRAGACKARPSCDQLRAMVYIGDFDWGNGFDPPNKVFSYRFRFMPREDTLRSPGPGCPLKD